MDHSRLVGERVILRRPNASDIEVRLQYGTDPDIANMYGVSKEDVNQPTREKMELWLERELANPYSWVIEVAGELAGQVFLPRVNGQDRHATIAIGMFHRRFIGLGYGNEAMQLVLKFAFEELKLHRVELRVFDVNQRALKTYESLGFRREGLERETTFVDGEWRNDVIMSILEQEFNF